MAKSKNQEITRILSSYSFNLYYIKEKDMLLSDFLSIQKVGDTNPHEIILKSFSMREVLQKRYYNFGNMTEEDSYLVQTSRVKVPEVHRIEKSLALHGKPERLKSVKLPTDERLPTPKLRIGQGRARIR